MRPSLLRPVLLRCTLGLLLGLTLGWLLGSESGLQASLRWLAPLAPGELRIDGASGRWLGPLRIDQLDWTADARRVQVEHLELDWQPGALTQGRFEAEQLHIGRLQVIWPASPTPTPAPENLRLPLAVSLASLRLDHLDVAGMPELHDVSARFHSTGQDHVLETLRLQLAESQLSAQGQLHGDAPFALQATARLTGQLAERPFALNLSADGPLNALQVDLQAEQGWTGQAALTLDAFAPHPLLAARLALDHVDPAAWHTGAPGARLRIDLDLRADAEGRLSGPLAVLNRQPGRLDQQRLPLTQLKAQLHQTDEKLRLEDLSAHLPGAGELTGAAQWQAKQAALNLRARRLDLAQLHGSLRSTALAGQISAELSADQQRFLIALSDPRFRIDAEGSLAAARLHLPRLTLSSGTASLNAQGELQLDGPRRLTASGQLNHFDPARFGRFPAADLNARVELQGSLGERGGPQLDGQLHLSNSRFAGLPLNGGGRLQWRGSTALSLDLDLQAGANRLQAHGGLGRPDDRLTLNLSAPQLAPFGLNGDLDLQAVLQGPLSMPAIEARLNSRQLARSGVGRIEQFMLNTRLDPRSDAALTFELGLHRASLPDWPDLLSELKLQATGRNRAHQIRLQATVDRQQTLNLAAQGGWSAPAGGWQGQLTRFDLAARQAARAFTLNAPSPLEVTRHGGRLGPLRLRGQKLDWQAELSALSDARHAEMALQASGSRLGQIAARLNLPLNAPWHATPDAPLQGSLHLALRDLGWLGDWLDDGVRSAGQIDGDLRVGGTLNAPQWQGQLSGSQLALSRPEQGLDLDQGRFRLDIERNRLRLEQASFASRLQTPPRALRLKDDGALAALTAQPGRIELQGELQVDRRAERGWLDWRLERIGPWQLPEQWLLLSGKGRLSWQDGALGVQGQVAADAGYWALAPGGAPRLSDDVVIRRGPEAASGGLRPRLDLDLGIDLGPRFLFSGAGLSARLDGDLRLKASGRDLPRASGTVRTRDGRFEAYGQTLSLERGILHFQGLPDNPALDVRALRKGQAVEAGVQVSGTAQRPVVKLISEPALPDAEKLSWLVLGHGPEQMGAGDASLLLSAAGGLLGNDAGGLLQQLRTQFGFDEFGVRQGTLGDSSGRRASSRVAGSTTVGNESSQQIFSVGKRLSANTVLSYEQALGKAESIVKLSVNLGRRLTLIGRAGSDNAVDLFWTRRFGGPERSGDSAATPAR
jgi:translocation and assembly module TamB